MRMMNLVSTGSTSVTVVGVGFGTFAQSLVLRGHETASEGTEWVSQTSIRCRASAGMGSSHAVVLTAGKRLGSRSAAYSSDIGQVHVGSRTETQECFIVRSKSTSCEITFFGVVPSSAWRFTVHAGSTNLSKSGDAYGECGPRDKIWDSLVSLRNNSRGRFTVEVDTDLISRSICACNGETVLVHVTLMEINGMRRSNRAAAMPATIIMQGVNLGRPTMTTAARAGILNGFKVLQGSISVILFTFVES
jgi:hypothetical protein